MLGGDPRKHALRDYLDLIWQAGRDFFAATPEITGAQLYAHMCELGRAAGWEFGGHIAGHTVGQFPHERISGSSIQDHIMPRSDQPMRSTDEAGLLRHWILEVHLVDRDAKFGGFYEQLLDIGPNAYLAASGRAVAALVNLETARPSGSSATNRQLHSICS